MRSALFATLAILAAAAPARAQQEPPTQPPPLFRAVANVVHHCGVSLDAAVAAASTNPARLLGLTDRGRIEPGARAERAVVSAGGA